MILASIIFSSCEESVDGCLDRRAGNFDVTAVTGCDDCCVFPIVSLDVNFVDQDTVSFSFNTKYEIGDDSVIVTDFILGFSEFYFYSGTEVYRTLDTVPEMQEIKDDFIAIEDASSKKSIGEAKFLVNLDSVSMRLGYDELQVRRIGDPEIITDGTKLSTMLGRLYVDSTDTYLQAKMALEIGDSTRLLDFATIDNPILGFPEAQELIIGQAWSIDFNMDMTKVLQGIRETDTNEELLAKISNNISAAAFKE